MAGTRKLRYGKNGGGGPRNRRAGCRICKRWKVNGARTEAYDGEKFSDRRRRHSQVDLTAV